MATRAERKWAKFTAAMGQWAVRMNTSQPNTKIGEYCAGVYASTQFHLGEIPLPSTYDPHSKSPWCLGFQDAAALLTAVEVAGFIPGKDFAALLRISGSGII